MSLEELNQKLKQQNLIGYWTIPNTSTGFREPEASYRPFLWKWNEIRVALDDAARFIRPEEAFRRFIGYQHPELDWCRQNYGILRPHSTSTPASNLYRPPHRYSWQDTEKALASMIEAPGDPYDGILLRYSDPVSGGSTLPTMNCEVQMFRPGEQGRSHRHTYTGRPEICMGTRRFICRASVELACP